MSDAHASERSALLTAWLVDVQRTKPPPPPPRHLTPGDFAAAGFRFYGEAAARYVREIECWVNFTQDLKHQAVLVHPPRRPGSALLWIDTEAVAMPVDASGDPQVEALRQWLDYRFSKAFPTAVSNPARAVSLWSWTTQAGRIATSGPHSFTHTYPAPPRELTRADCEVVGFELAGERSAESFLDEAGECTVHVEFSPRLQHQAVLIQRASDWAGALLWVDGEPVPVPRSTIGNPMCNGSVEWLDDRFVYAQTGGLWDHPQNVPGSSPLLGNVRGLMIWDATKQVQHLELPDASQTWVHPILIARGRTWRIYANGETFKQDRPDRTLPIPL